MKNIGNSIYYANFQPKYTSLQIGRQKISTIIIGGSGVGKSRLVNNLCGSSHKVAINRKVITDKIQGQRCIYFQNFQIYDSPGFQSMRETIVNMIKENKELNTIFIMSKLQSRFGNTTLPNLRNIQKYFSKMNKQIVFLVSHLDILSNDSNKQQVMNDFFNSLTQYEFNQKVIVFSNQYKDFENLTNLMYEICINYEKIQQKSTLQVQIPNQKPNEKVIQNTKEHKNSMNKYVVNRKAQEQKTQQQPSCLPCKLI